MDSDETQEKTENLHERVQQLELREKALMENQKCLEEDFGLKRAKLKDLYMQKEEELRACSEENSVVVAELEQLKVQLLQLQDELEEARSEAMIAQCTAENDIAVERRKCQEEIATLQQLMKEEVTSAVGKTGSRYEGEIQRLKKLNEKLEGEKQQYRHLYEQCLEESELKQRGESLLSPGVLSAVTKSLAKRVPSLSPAHSSATANSEKAAAGTLGNLPADTVAPGKESLEESMRKAQDDAVLLRSLVVPLEQEIAALKDKIREQDVQLRAQEAQQQAAIRTSDVLGPLLQGKNAAQLVKELDEKLKDVNNTLEAEKSSRADLELYVAILNTQKMALADDIDRLRGQLVELRQVYDSERRVHNELKSTWERANDQFIAAQRLHLADMQLMRSLLSAEQLRHLQELQSADEGNDAFSSEDFKESLDAQSDNMTLSTTCAESRHDSSRSSPSFLMQSHSPSMGKSGVFGSQEGELDRGSSDDTGSLLINLQEGSESETVSVTEGEGDGGAESLAVRFSPEKMPRLTEDQRRALAEPEILEASKESRSESADCQNEFSSLLAIKDTRSLTVGGQRVVSEKEWQQLQGEIRRARSRMLQPCPTCPSLDSKLQKVEADLKESEKEKSLLDKALGRQRDELNQEGQYRKKMEAKWKEMADEYERREQEIANLVAKATLKNTEVVSRWKAAAAGLQDQLRSLTEKREILQQELIRLQTENDSLVGKHSQHSQELQNEIINLPDTMEEMQLLLLRYREDIIAAKVAKEHLEETLNSKILFLKDQVSAEQHERNTMEEKLSTEVDQLRSRVAMLESLKHQVEVERREKDRYDTRLREIEQKHQEQNVRTQQIISALKTQVAEQTQAKTRLEAEVLELRGRVATLQHELGTSEAVQRDFVRLSQSLQVQLEKIRQSENEVRWQNEEDIEECNGCKQRFSAVGRRKHHCRHCGKIFCGDCVSKSVPSGPHGRPSKVCDVCHTLLVQDATPYFSTEPPQSPV